MILPEKKLLMYSINRGPSLDLAQSCTGGAHLRVCEYLKGAMLCYQTSIKTKLLNVSKALIHQHSVFRAEVASQAQNRYYRLMSGYLLLGS